MHGLHLAEVSSMPISQLHEQDILLQKHLSLSFTLLERQPHGMPQALIGF